MNKVEFQTIKTGAAFTSTSGDFVKINECVAKRTEAHWATSEKTWSFSPIDTVYIQQKPYGNNGVQDMSTFIGNYKDLNGSTVRVSQEEHWYFYEAVDVAENAGGL
jgi:hypothetical protein